MKTKVFMVYKLQNQKGNYGEQKKIEIKSVIVDAEGCISPKVYDQVKRTSLNLIKELSSNSRNFQMHLELEDGRKDTFGGYPAANFLLKVKFA